MFQPEYFITPRVPGVRPADPPNYDGIVFVYVFTQVLDPWVVPPQLQNVVLVVANAQGFVPGMSIIIEGAGAFQVVSTDALNRMTVQNLGYFQNAAPGTGIAPGKITTTSLPGPQGDQGIQGIPGVAATVTAGSTTTSSAGQNANVVNSGTPQAAVFDFTIPRGPTGPQGAQGAPGQAYNNVTTAAFTAANAPTVQTLSLSSTTGLATGVTLNIDPIGYYKVTGVISGTQVNVVNTGTPSNAAAGTVSPSGSAVLGTGPQGPPGNAATVAVGTTTTGAAGANASVTNTGSSSAAVFNFTVPQGIAGTQGPQGPAGSSGAPGTSATVAVGTTTTGAPGSNASVTNTGSPNAGIFNFTVPQGLVGAQGPQGTQGTAGNPGAPGTAASIAAGTTSTGLPGTNASVNNSGSSSAAVFNFTIPRGDVGAAGPTGATGPAGPTGSTGAPGTAGLNAFNITSGGFTVPPVGSTVTVTLNDASWVVVGQMIYCDSAGGGAGQAGALQVTAKTGNQITLLNPAPAPAIPPADATQAGLLKQLSGNTTDYVGGDNACHGLVAALATLLIPTGTILDFGGASAPNGFLLCNGSAISRTTYATLFTVISTAFGTGDGSTTFNLPDFRGRTAVGVGQGAALTNRVLAATGGEEAHQLAIAELASHAHLLPDLSHSHQTYYVTNSGSGSGASQFSNAPGSGSTTTSTALTGTTSINTQNAGSGTAHNTMPPFIAVNKIIKT
jgi:microcystin-dependent protein